MVNTDANLAQVATISVRSSGLVHSAESDILRLQQILREGYASGFTIFKELLQNAEDAGATRLSVIGHGGFPEATNPLLRAPGLIVANDGPVLARHMDAITRASGGSKADERSAVGRFGLGQKSVYHLCDAFIALGQVEDTDQRVQLLIMNPWERISEARAASELWPGLSDLEAQMLTEKVKGLGFSKGMALFLPLRTAALRPGAELSLSDTNWEPDRAIAGIMDGEELAATLCCLRNLEKIEIRPTSGLGRTLSLKAGTQRLSGPGVEQGDATIAGQVAGAGFKLSFSGRQQWLPAGQAASLLQQKGWDKVFDIHRALIPPKANPHAAVIVCRSAVATGAGKLRLRNAVYLPLGEPIFSEPLEGSAHHIDLLIHGYFFVSSDRKKLRNDDHIETRWNDELLREGSLPLVLDVLADAFGDLADDQERHAVIRVLQGSSWWQRNRASICQRRALAKCWPGQKTAAWQVRPVQELRPVPSSVATSLTNLKSALPGLEDWCTSNRVSLGFGPVLAEQPLLWPDAQLAQVVQLAGAEAFTKAGTAETLAALLDQTSPGPLTQAALTDSYRMATCLVESSFAKADKLKLLVRHLPSSRVFPLPPSVENRELIRALVASGPALPVNAKWVSAERDAVRRLGLEEAIDLLTAVEPFLTGQGEIAQQASSLVSHVLRHGPSLDDLARHERAKNLRVIPARWMQAEDEERLSLGRIDELTRAGLLFDAAPNQELSVLAGAVSSPAIYRLGLREGGIDNLASAKKPACLLAVLRQAESFGDPENCGKLAEILCVEASKEDLRRLVARDPDLPAHVPLVELDRFAIELDDLVDSLLKNRNDRLVSSATRHQLMGKTCEKIGLVRVDGNSLGSWILEAIKINDFPALADSTAMALLNSSIDKDILKQLPLHKCEGLDHLLSAGEVFIGRRIDVPPRLAVIARLVELWPDQAASSMQNQLIARWGPEATIATCLATEEPAQFTAEICDALGRCGELSEALAAQLKHLPWISAGEATWKPTQVLNLPVEAEKAFEALVAERAEFLLASQLPGCLREQAVCQRLATVMPDRSESFGMAFLYAAENGLVGLCLDATGALDDLRKIARGSASLDIAAWPLIAAALRDFLPDETIIDLLNCLPKPDRPSIIAQLNALVGLTENGTIGEAARRLYRQGYFLKFRTLSSAIGYLPADLLVPSVAGPFRRADAIALHSEGIVADALLARDYAQGLGTEDQTLATAQPSAPADLAESLSLAFSSLNNLDVGDGILLALGMLGRGEDLRNLARQWQGQRPFDRIWDELDSLADELRGLRNANQDRLAELRFDISFPKDGLVCVPSASGSDCIVPLSGSSEALLIECSQLGLERDNAGYRHVWRLVFGSVAPRDESDAKSLLDQFVRKLAPAIMLGLDRHKQALSDLLSSYFLTDQRTLEDTSNELKEVLHDRLRGLKPGPIMNAAVREYDRNCYRDREHARDALWLAARSAEGSAELLAATRRKIAEMGYEPDRSLFELYQNAVDAQAQWEGQGRFRVEVSRDHDGSITSFRVVHWGRPINQPGGDPHLAELEGHRRDLANMLAINHSAKDGDVVTGRFGLGFKTVHMLADEVLLASGGIAIRILGGMIPVDWSAGGSEVAPFNNRGRKATLIHIPIAPDRRNEAESAWNAFQAAAPVLAALGQGGAIELDDAGKPFQYRDDEHQLTGGVCYIQLDDRRHVLCLSLRDGFRLFIPFGETGPHAFPDSIAQFWHLVPLVGERRRGAWLMEGRFQVDPGRTQFSGAADAKEQLFGRLGAELGARIVALYDFLLTGYADFARNTGLDPAGRDDFWRRLVQLFSPDIARGGPERALHEEGRGLANLLAERPLVPLAFGGAACASAVQWRLAGALASPDVRHLVESWPAIDAFKQSLVDQQTADLLAQLDLPNGRRLDLPTLVRSLSDENGIGPELAATLAGLLADDIRSQMPADEERSLRQTLRDLLWLAEDGSLQQIRHLSFPKSSTTAEAARAWFAPPKGTLASAYRDAGFALAEFAREQAGHNLEVWEGWAASANNCVVRQTAFIRYLVDHADQKVVGSLAQAAKWLPQGAQLAASSLLDDLTPTERNLLLAKLGIFSSVPADDIPQPLAHSIDPAEALLAIAQWWRNNRQVLRPAYDRAVYPEGFTPAALVEGDRIAWFTILALGSFQTLGRIRPQQSRQFVANAIEEGWWHKLALVDPSDPALGPFAERLRAWSEPNEDESYLMWRRCLTDLCLIARHLDGYRQLFMKLPAVIGREGDVSLRNHLRPAFSHVAQRMGLDVAPLARSLGIGANWVVRELARHGVYSQEQAERVLPYGWSSAERVRRLLRNIRMGEFEHGIDEGRLLHQAVAGLIDDEARFCGDGDLPLHVITLAKHRSARDRILLDAGRDDLFEANGYGDSESEDDDA